MPTPSRPDPTLALLTPAGPGTEDFLAELAASIHDQADQPWSWSWTVVCDGPDAAANAARGVLATDLGATSVIVNHDRYWRAASLNRALAHVEADWVVALDADDVLLPDAMTSWRAAAEEAGPTWCGFPMLDWHPETGALISFPDPFPHGPIRAGVWLEAFTRTGRHPLAVLPVLWPTRMLIGVGGWAANPAAEDAAPALVASTRWDGWWYPQPTLRYRKHPGQITHGGDQRPVAAAAADGRLLAVRQARLAAELDQGPATPARGGTASV